MAAYSDASADELEDGAVAVGANVVEPPGAKFLCALVVPQACVLLGKLPAFAVGDAAAGAWNPCGAACMPWEATGAVPKAPNIF